MAVERKFISEGVRKARVEKYLTKELKRAGYGGMDIARTPLGTQVTIFAEKPGIVIGKGGKLVHQLTLDLAQNYGVESPQIEVQQVTNPSFNAQIMAERLANALETRLVFPQGRIQHHAPGHGLRCAWVRSRYRRETDRCACPDPEVYRRVHQALR